VKVEREAEKRAAELKREAQRVQRDMSEEARSKTRAQRRQPQGQEGACPAASRREGIARWRSDQRVSGINDDDSRKPRRQEPARAPGEGYERQDARAAGREIQVGDRVRLLVVRFDWSRRSN
jgi:hypothetical protein